MREGDESLRQQAGQLASLQAENGRLSSLAANVSLSKRQADDLQKLRAEAGTLKQRSAYVAQLRDENRQLKAKTGQDQPKNPMQIKEEFIARANYGKNWAIAFYHYAEKNGVAEVPDERPVAAAFAPDAVTKRQTKTDDRSV